MALLGTAANLSAQISVQRITISLLAEYQANTFATNTSSGAPLTNTYSKIKTILIATGNVVKSIAIDMAGPNWTEWSGAELVREVNLTNGHEGIFLRKGTNNVNLSNYFSGTFSNNFTSGWTNGFPAATNNIYGQTNLTINGMSNNAAPSFELVRGVLRQTGTTNFTTNDVTTAGLYFLSLNTTNIKFSIVGSGDGTVQNVAGSISGTRYERAINSEIFGSVGTFLLNVTSNIFNTGTDSPAYVTGPLRGTIFVGTPNFSTITGP